MAYDDSSSSLYQTTGLQTLKGDTGPQGVQGVPGVPGNTIWSGNGPPANTLGLPGDFYVDLTNFLFYGPNTFSGWPSSGVTTRGPQGSVGPTGPQGSQGIQGPSPFQTPAAAWAPSTNYSATAPISLVYYQNSLYICTITHVSQGTFGAANWQMVVGAPSYDNVTLTTSAKAPTPTAGDNSTAIATTAFITTALSAKAAKGANSDITSLTGLTTALSPGQGGTGRQDSRGLADGQCYLQFVSATQIALVPQDGGNLIINGVQCQVPSGGVTVAPGGSASVSYWAYAYMLGGTMMLETSGTGPALDSYGRFYKTGDTTRRYVGRVRLNGSVQFQDDANARWVISWFNRKTKVSYWTFSTGTSSTSNVSLTGGHAVLVFGDEAFEVATYANVGLNTSGTTPYTPMQVFIDGSGAPSNGQAFGNIINQYTNTPGVARAIITAVEGVHIIDTAGLTSSGNVTFNGTMMCIQRC